MVRWATVMMAVAATMASAAEPGLTPVPFGAVEVTDEFWAPRMKINRERTIPHNFRMCEETGRVNNLRRAGGLLEGKEFEGFRFNDSDVYKVLEGACYELARKPDAALQKQVDDLIAVITAAQQPDGYLNSHYTLTQPDARWTNVKDAHEMYCGGHLIEAAVAHYQATGKRTLLDVAVRFADHVASLFGPDKRRDVPGHQEIELALVRLSTATGDTRYRELAQFFLEGRGRAHGRELYGDYCQDHAPIDQQSEIVGHAVRAVYYYCGLADVMRAAGSDAHLGTLQRIWDDVTQRKLYVTGGIGPSAHNEGFTIPYDLPNQTAYCESCASIGLVFWAHRMNLLTKDARYVNVLERVLYNSLPAGVSLSGDRFFYENPLAGRGDHHRRPWYGCACCPPNFARFFPTLGGYIYAADNDGIYVNLYVTGRAEIRVAGVPVKVEQKTDYPWDGKVRLKLSPSAEKPFAVCLRLPDWCPKAEAKINGQTLEDPFVRNGYLRIERAWKPDDVVELSLAMPIQRIEANPRVMADRGRVALRRGPIVYCVEAQDAKGAVDRLVLPRDAALNAVHRKDLLGGVTVIEGRGREAAAPAAWGSDLYRPVKEGRTVEFTAIPYCVWDNRKAGPMAVWLPESDGLVPPQPAAGIKASASHVHGDLAAMHDGIEPAWPGDSNVPRLDWWDHLGTAEWVQYEFEKPRRVAGIDVYWFDDSHLGGRCRVPASWKALYRNGEEWREAANGTGYGTRSDQVNRLRFDPVETTGLRLEVQLQPEFSGGVLEWAVLEDPTRP
ncbi:MAG: glycoside hydrolase family 127 protein [Phycisphaerae bacterium]|nr:glycoside hydrolase family 127 protein [Phycisphaerae bacterium]